jgi:UDP-3-O-[3-hydroxymyristoyl] glucosamine N-acyltransferase
MEFSANQIAQFLQGTIEGNQEAMVSNISPIEDGKPGTLAFLANPKYTKYIYSTLASIVLVNKSFKPEKSLPETLTLIRVEDAYTSFAKLLDLYNQQKEEKTGIDEKASIEQSASIGNNVYIGAFAYIGKNARIGDNVKIFPQVYIGDNVEIKDSTVIYPGVKIYENCKIGLECIIHAGVIVGSDGFGFAPKSQEDFQKVPQVGNVIIEDRVEIGANTTIDRATMGSTIIHNGVKLDNLIQVAHNVEIGENTVVCAQTGISGSTKVGRDCMLAGQVGLTGHLEIADDVKIAAQSGISSSIRTPGEIVLGSPGFNIRNARKSIAIYRNLPSLREKILSLEKELEKLKSNIAG